ncbi:hypothetical protein ACLWQU_001728 [Campylobacter jejuni]|nr:hypothetical protein [Campylobacter jejuni]HEE6720764.1 hypothetical protein [Campylobacter coli]HEE9604998.1 hypothetical protein [Campylobacter jejuni subsp. jejuni]ECL2706845.1 hypothetical protein [Campylobacter jejuni]ECL2707104.1 hypothetical protein [Campylobacter jejuni]
MSFYYDILNAGFFYFVSIVTGLTIILTMVLFLMLNKFFPVKLFEFNIKKEIIKGIIIFLGGINIIVFIAIFTSQAKIPNQAYIYKLKKENIVIKAYDFLYSNYNTLGFGICENDNYTGETCLNYLKYFEEIEKRKALKTEKQKKSYDEKQKIIEENINKLDK